MRGNWILVVTGVLIGLSGCSPVGTSLTQTIETAALEAPEGEGGTGTPNAPDQPDDNTPGKSDPAPILNSCLKLDFIGVKWSTKVPLAQREMLSLALDITGSFEGHEGWANLTDNFDGQGLSMGLLQQNLGQGSLQPMWVELQLTKPSVMKSAFTPENFKSLIAMLGQWRGMVFPASINLRDYGYSELDDMAVVAEELGIDPNELMQMHSALLARNQTAVNWAIKTLYTKGNFKSDWAKQLSALAVTSDYRTLQINRAEHLHLTAMGMLKTLKLTELRSYLFLFDIAVQNGGMSTFVRDRYKIWLKAHPNTTDLERLTELLALRLKSMTNRKYVSDVRDRKTAIMTGKGTVHGRARHFEKEYCVSLSTKL